MICFLILILQGVTVRRSSGVSKETLNFGHLNAALTTVTDYEDF